METKIIETKNKSDIKFWLNLAKKTGAKAKSVNTEDIEDTALAKLIEKGMNKKNVSRSIIMKALGR